jgi:hypothetical protein
MGVAVQNQGGGSAEILIGAPRPFIVTVASGSNINLALPSGNVIYNIAALGGSALVKNPTGTPYDGQLMRQRWSQDNVGGHTLAWDTQFAFGSDITAALVPTASGVAWEQLFGYYTNAGNWRALGIARGF